MPEISTVSEPTPHQVQRSVLRAATQASGCVGELIEALHSDGQVDFDNTIGLLADALVALGEATDDIERDGQLVAAAHKWIGENR